MLPEAAYNIDSRKPVVAYSTHLTNFHNLDGQPFNKMVSDLKYRINSPFLGSEGLGILMVYPFSEINKEECKELRDILYSNTIFGLDFNVEGIRKIGSESNIYKVLSHGNNSSFRDNYGKIKEKMDNKVRDILDNLKSTEDTDFLRNNDNDYNYFKNNLIEFIYKLFSIYYLHALQQSSLYKYSSAQIFHIFLIVN